MEVSLYPSCSEALLNVHRNLGILFALMLFFAFTYLVSTEFISAKKSKGEVLLFPRSHIPTYASNNDEEGIPDTRPTSGNVTDEKNDDTAAIVKQTAIFHWQDVVYDIKIKGEPRRLLDHVDGWVKPGTLTALMVICSLFI